MQKYHLKNRPDRELKDFCEIEKILANGKYCTISMCKNNEPYIVTLSYGFEKESQSLYFHCAESGLKIDFIKENPNVCATIIEDGGYIQNECGHNYRSLIICGTIKLLHENEEKRNAMKCLLQHLEKTPEIIEKKMAASEGFFDKMTLLKLTIQQITGKAGR